MWQTLSWNLQEESTTHSCLHEFGVGNLGREPVPTVGTVPNEDKETASKYRVKNGNSAEAKNRTLRLLGGWGAQKNFREFGESIDFPIRHGMGFPDEFM